MRRKGEPRDSKNYKSPNRSPTKSILKTLHSICLPRKFTYYNLRRVDSIDELVRWSGCSIFKDNTRCYFFLEALWRCMDKRGCLYHKKRKPHLVKVMMERLDGRMELFYVEQKPCWIFSIRM